MPVIPPPPAPKPQTLVGKVLDKMFGTYNRKRLEYIIEQLQKQSK